MWKTFWDTGLSLDYISVSRIKGHGLWKTLSDSGISRIVDGHFCSPKKVLKTQQLQLYTRSHLQKPPGCNQVPYELIQPEKSTTETGTFLILDEALGSTLILVQTPCSVGQTVRLTLL